MPLVLLFNRPLKFGQKLVEVMRFRGILFFHMVIVNPKHLTYIILWWNVYFSC